MNGLDGNQPERLDDQIRRMILTNGSPHANGDDMNRTSHPTVRLPPASSHHQTVQAPSNGPYAAGPSQSQAPPRAFGNGFQGLPTHHPANNAGPSFQRGSYQHDRGHATRHPNQGGRGGFQASPSQPSNRNTPHETPNRGGIQRSRMQQQMPLDPDAFQRRSFHTQETNYRPQSRPYHNQQQSHQQLYNPNQPPPRSFGPTLIDQHNGQTTYLESLAAREIPLVQMTPAEYAAKESFRLTLQTLCDDVCARDPERLQAVSLEAFGSFRSGFATAGSDMDLVIVPVVQNTYANANVESAARFSLLQDDLPRALEKRLLDAGIGARLLTKTRVPILKVCELPGEEFLGKLRVERERWEELEDGEKYPHLFKKEDVEPVVDLGNGEGAEVDVDVDVDVTDKLVTKSLPQPEARMAISEVKSEILPSTSEHVPDNNKGNAENIALEPAAPSQNEPRPKPTRRTSPNWTRERKSGPLDFPPNTGIQTDINFFNPLGIHNTALLRCYSLCDPRVEPMILFVKTWAKRRKINSSYSGTLSSYGFVLMVLQFLVNVARPPVLPNLQSGWRPQGIPPASQQSEMVDDWSISFWRNESEIIDASRRGLLTINREPLGSLLAGFFHYFASQSQYGHRHETFNWMSSVLSLRNPGGLLTKADKGWVKAVTEEAEGKRVQHRYLFCVEDPFELSHNVARTVTHKGIVAIRDEFRRARRILIEVGRGALQNAVGREGELMEELVEASVLAKDTDGPQPQSTPMTDAASIPQHSDPKPSRPSRQQNPDVTTQKGLNVTDQESFPYLLPGLAPAKTSKHPKQKKKPVNTITKTVNTTAPSPRSPRSNEAGDDASDYSEISGEKAKKVLEEVRARRLDEGMEATARGVVMSVLGDWE